MGREVKSISDQLPGLAATRTEIEGFKSRAEKYDRKLKEAVQVIGNGVDVRVAPAELSADHVQLLGT